MNESHIQKIVEATKSFMLELGVKAQDIDLSYVTHDYFIDNTQKMIPPAPGTIIKGTRYVLVPWGQGGNPYGEAAYFIYTDAVYGSGCGNDTKWLQQSAWKHPVREPLPCTIAPNVYIVYRWESI